MFDEGTAAEGASLVTGESASGSPVAAGQPLALVSALLTGVYAGVRAVAFWIAALLPAAVLVGLVLGMGQGLPALAGVLALDAVCAVVGHGHSPGP